MGTVEAKNKRKANNDKVDWNTGSNICLELQKKIEE